MLVFVLQPNTRISPDLADTHINVGLQRSYCALHKNVGDASPLSCSVLIVAKTEPRVGMRAIQRQRTTQAILQINENTVLKIER
jgi:hypothetical protein